MMIHQSQDQDTIECSRHVLPFNNAATHTASPLILCKRVKLQYEILTYAQSTRNIFFVMAWLGSSTPPLLACLGVVVILAIPAGMHVISLKFVCKIFMYCA